MWKITYLLKMLTGTKWSADKVMIIRLYLALIKPKLNYGSEANDSACKTYLKSLQPIQNAAIRTALGAVRSSSILSVHAESGLVYLEKYKDIKMMNYYLRTRANWDQAIWKNLNRVYNGCTYSSRVMKPYLIRVNDIVEKYNLDFENIHTETGYLFLLWETLATRNCI